MLKHDLEFESGLFVPCYIDQFLFKSGHATLELLEKSGVEVDTFKDNMLRSTVATLVRASTQSCNDLFIENFSELDYMSPLPELYLNIKDTGIFRSKKRTYHEK